jgi:hypothetical protein
MGGPTSGRRNASSTPGLPAPHRRRCQGQAATRIQWGRPEPGCSSNAPPRDAGAINHRGAPRSDGPRAPPPEGRGTPRNIMPRLLDSCGKPWSTPGARATQRLRPRVASATSTITATVGPTSTRGCAEATTPGVEDATTAGRIGVPRPNHPVRRPSAVPYDGRHSRPGSDPRLLSQSTRGRRDQNCGSRTTSWPANWVERTMTTSSSATSPCSSPTPLAPGWSTCLRGRSPTGTTWSKPSPAISRARTYAPEIPGTSEAADSSRESLSGTTSGDSRSSAPRCPTSPIQMSSARSSPATTSRRKITRQESSPRSTTAS